MRESTLADRMCGATSINTSMEYEQIVPISRQEADRALDSGSEGHAAKAMIAVALHEPDRRWAEQKCLQGLRDHRAEVRAAATVGLGHIARIHRQMTTAVVLPQLKALRSDPLLGGVADDALDDILIFLGDGES